MAEGKTETRMPHSMVDLDDHCQLSDRIDLRDRRREDQIEPAERPWLDRANVGGRVHRQYCVRGCALPLEEMGFLRIRRHIHFGLGNQSKSRDAHWSDSSWIARCCNSLWSIADRPREKGLDTIGMIIKGCLAEHRDPTIIGAGAIRVNALDERYRMPSGIRKTRLLIIKPPKSNGNRIDLGPRRPASNETTPAPRI